MEQCDSRKNEKEEEIHMGKEGSFYMHIFGMNNKERLGRKCLGARLTMEGKLWKMFGVED
jgi:hypothetical protein